MNEKFFDLKKEKQDRMINAALKIFAMNGYAHASTDDMVREAGISKGLLFHYFGSKAGIYSFVYDYSVRYMTLELSTGISKEETDYFGLLGQIKAAQLQVLRNYPYMQQFLNKSSSEDVKEALMETEEKRNLLPLRYLEIMEQADLNKFKTDVDVEKLSRMIDFTLNGIMTKQFQDGTFQAELYYEESRQYLDMIKKLAYR